MDDQELNDTVDAAVARARHQWLTIVRELADWCEDLAPTFLRHDEALAHSMEFVALRARRVADRIEGEL